MRGRTVSKELKQLAESRGDEDLRDKKLWGAVLAGPLLWFFELTGRYFAVEAGAPESVEPLLAGIALLTALVTLGAAGYCHRAFRRAPNGPRTGMRFLALMGAVVNGLLALLIAVEALPHLWLDARYP